MDDLKTETSHPPRVAFVSNTDWYLYNFRMNLLHAARERTKAEVLCITPPGPYVHRLQGAGFAWAPLRMSRQGVNPFSELRAFLDLYRIYREFKPDLVHHFTLKCVIYGSMAAQTARVPRVVNALAGLGTTFSGTSTKGKLIRPFVSAILKHHLRASSRICILQNPDDLALIAQMIGERGSLRLILGSGVDMERFQPAPEAEDPKVVLFVGRLLKDKGIQEFCRAAALVRARGHDVEFRVVGSIDPGNPASLTAGELSALAGRPELNFVGHQEDMPTLFRQAFALVLPTRYGEGVPRSLVEGAASGLPLIATDHPGCREIVIDQRNGFLLPGPDPEGIASAVIELATRKELRESMGRESRALAVAHFSSDSVVAATLEAYKDLDFPL